MSRCYFIVVVAILASLFLGCSHEEPKAIAPSPPPPPTASPPPAPSPSPKELKAAQELRQSGLDYRRQGRYSEAVTALEESVALDPQNLSGRVILGWTLHLAGREQEATAALEQAIAKDSRNVEALNALGIVYLVSGNLDSAVATHTQAVDLDPNNDIGYYNLSLAHHCLQQYDQAIAQGKQAATLEPGNPHHWVALAISYWDKGEAAIAQQTYQKAVNLDPRYRSREFLTHLKQAGFSLEQIQTVEQVLKAL